jgi:coniferyl-aldehyde dehydrogenase
MNQALPATAVAALELREVLALQRAAFARERHPSLATRLDRLDRLAALTERIAPELVTALAEDFGHRSSHVTRLADLMMVEAAIRHTRRHLKHWMKPRHVPTPMAFQPATSRLLPQALGVVGIVAPWNYPFQLAVAPAAAALAAGNRVMIKPSELTPRCSELLRRAVAESFQPDEMTVLTGDAEVGRAFVTLPFDHLLFTGSTAVGRQVALAAAANLTPVTLELGGKSPAILNADCDLGQAATSLALGKMFNAGQTCIAPDYVVVPRELVGPFRDAMTAAMGRLYPDLPRNPDVTSIVNDRHHARLQALLADARERGAEVVPLAPSTEASPHPRLMAPALVLNVNDGMRIMQEEIFGPLLPVVPYDSVDEVIERVNRFDRPLALYWYGRDTQARDRVLQETVSGGVTVNDCMWHFGQEELPFGGVGASGMGAYHGEAGFRTFSQYKPVLVQSRLAGTPLLHPPYGKVFEFMMKLLKRIT